ncbi:hypothetical protein M9458_031078, partial [Cirrhinus mrigala]
KHSRRVEVYSDRTAVSRQQHEHVYCVANRRGHAPLSHLAPNLYSDRPKLDQTAGSEEDAPPDAE